MYMLLSIIFIIIIFSVSKSFATKQAKEARKRFIYNKYGNAETAEKIINEKVWVGQTKEQLCDSWGKPLDIDESVLKTKTKEI